MVENERPEKQGKGEGREREEYAFNRLSEAFETSARRWELIVYPTLFAFIILAGYGFYLIYSLARDVHHLALTVDTNMTVMASNFQSVSSDMNRLTGNIQTMAVDLSDISQKVSTLEPMLTNMDSMDRSMDSMDRAIRSITLTTHNMRGDMATLNQNVSRPMSFMNTFMPW